MWLVLLFLGVLLLVRGVIAAFASLRGIPRSNRDWIHY